MVFLERSLGWSKNELRSNIGRVAKNYRAAGLAGRPIWNPFKGGTNRKTQVRLRKDRNCPSYSGVPIVW
jgi:hypothetical protein